MKLIIGPNIPESKVKVDLFVLRVWATSGDDDYTTSETVEFDNIPEQLQELKTLIDILYELMERPPFECWELKYILEEDLEYDEENADEWTTKIAQILGLDVYFDEFLAHPTDLQVTYVNDDGIEKEVDVARDGDDIVKVEYEYAKRI